MFLFHKCNVYLSLKILIASLSFHFSVVYFFQLVFSPCIFIFFSHLNFLSCLVLILPTYFIFIFVFIFVLLPPFLSHLIFRLNFYNACNLIFLWNQTDCWFITSCQTLIFIVTIVTFDLPLLFIHVLQWYSIFILQFILFLYLYG